MRKQTLTGDKIIFSIFKIIDKTNRNSVIYTDVSDELDDFTMPSYSLNNQIEELVKMTVKEQQPEQNDNTPKQIDESAKGQNFFQDNKNNKERKNTTTWIKSRNFLSNIAYVSKNREDLYNKIFFDV